MVYAYRRIASEVGHGPKIETATSRPHIVLRTASFIRGREAVPTHKAVDSDTLKNSMGFRGNVSLLKQRTKKTRSND